MGHVVTLCFFSSLETWVTGSQNWVTFVTWETIGHIDTKLGHVCDPGDFKNIGHNGTRVTGSRWSRWSRCVFFSRNAFHGYTPHTSVTNGTFLPYHEPHMHI